MRKTASQYNQVLEGIDCYDWTARPIDTFQILRDSVTLFYENKTPDAPGKRNDSPQDFIVAWSDSAYYIGRAYRLFRKTEYGPIPEFDDIPECEYGVWTQLDLGTIPDCVPAMMEGYNAGHLSVWIKTILDLKGIKNFPQNSFARENYLKFTSRGTLLFSFEDVTVAYKPISSSAYRGSGWEGARARPRFHRGLQF